MHIAAQSSHRNRNSAHATAAADRIARALLTHILLHFTALKEHFSLTVYCISLHFTASHCISLHFTALKEHFSLTVYCISLHFTASHCISLHFTALAGYFSARPFTAGRNAVQCIVISTENREPERGENRVSFYAG